MSADARVAASVAVAAGRLLLEIREEAFRSGVGGRELGAEGDRRSNELILAALRDERPSDAVLSEEAADDPVRLGADRVWIVDPLDGTREYGMEGRTDWAVHVALWERGRGLSAGAVAQPAIDAVYATDDLPVAGGELPVGRRPVVLVSDSRPPPFAATAADAVGADVVTMGSAGAKAMAVLRGEAEAYLHAGGQWEWDSAAPVAVVRAAGFHASRLDGSDLEYNAERPYLPDLLICRERLAGPLLSAVAPFLT